jgi:hypothetical protein
MTLSSPSRFQPLKFGHHTSNSFIFRMFGLGGGSRSSDEELWQDREIRFDSSPSLLDLRKGEHEIDSINSVEDTKGNNGERGTLLATNLRIIWCSHKSAKTNLSIGYSSIQNLTIRTAQSRLRGATQALYVMTKYNGARFEVPYGFCPGELVLTQPHFDPPRNDHDMCCSLSSRRL